MKEKISGGMGAKNVSLEVCDPTENGGVRIFRFRGDLVFESLPAVREAIMDGLLKDGGGRFLFDVSKVDLVDSAAIGFIVSSYKTALSSKGRFAVYCPEGLVKTCFDKVGLGRLIKVFESEEDWANAV